MGWNSHEDWRTQDDLVAHLRSNFRWGSDAKLNKFCVKGAHHWYQAERISDGTMFIGVDLLAYTSGEGWSYKALSEACGPCAYDCPLSYFTGLPEPLSRVTKEWREDVLQWHAKRKAIAHAKKSISPGTIVTIYEKDYKLLCNLGKQGWSAAGPDGLNYKLKPSQVNAWLKEVTA